METIPLMGANQRATNKRNTTLGKEQSRQTNTPDTAARITIVSHEAPHGVNGLQSLKSYYSGPCCTFDEGRVKTIMNSLANDAPSAARELR
jgi:hypothetical protein